MFTGIIQEMGKVLKISRSRDVHCLEVSCAGICSSVKVGDSVAIKGVCLTVTDKGEGSLKFDVMAKTMKTTNLSVLKEGQSVNMEGALKAGSTIDGHFVLGHIDCTGVIRSIGRVKDGFTVQVGYPREFSGLIVDKGSVAVDGISLTIGKAYEDMFETHIIPHTLNSTTLKAGRPGDTVNLEFDILGKYIARGLKTGKATGVTEEFLRSKGF